MNQAHQGYLTVNALSRLVFNNEGVLLFERLHIASFGAWLGVNPRAGGRDVGNDGNAAFLREGRHVEI